MNISAHVEKWKRFEGPRSLFDPVEEFEVWYWCMLAGAMAMINAALHACTITKENDHFATQIPDVYAVIDEVGHWHYEIDVMCDLIHVGLPALCCDIPEPVQSLFDAMHKLEVYRDQHVRGLDVATPDVISNCTIAYDEVVSTARKIIERNES